MSDTHKHPITDDSWRARQVRRIHVTQAEKAAREELAITSVPSMFTVQPALRLPVAVQTTPVSPELTAETSETTNERTEHAIQEAGVQASNKEIPNSGHRPDAASPVENTPATDSDAGQPAAAPPAAAAASAPGAGNPPSSASVPERGE